MPNDMGVDGSCQQLFGGLIGSKFLGENKCKEKGRPASFR